MFEQYNNVGSNHAGSKDDLGDFSKDSLQQALGNANLLHEKGVRMCIQICLLFYSTFLCLSRIGAQNAKLQTLNLLLM